MQKVAIVLLADTVSAEGMGRMANALTTAREFIEAGDDVAIVFDGAGTKWPVELSMTMHRYHDLFEAVRDRIVGVCDYCAAAFGVKDRVENLGLPLATQFEGHPSFRQLMLDGYTVLTF